MANTIYITAGLPVAKNSGQSPTAGVNTVYITAGLPPVVLSAATVSAYQLIDAGLVRSQIIDGGLVS